MPADSFWSIEVSTTQAAILRPMDRNARLDQQPCGNEECRRIGGRSSSGGCELELVPNCLPIMPGWNYTVRLYRPRAGSINFGEWTRPVSTTRELNASTAPVMVGITSPFHRHPSEVVGRNRSVNNS